MALTTGTLDSVYGAAREQLAPRLRQAQVKGAELLDSDAVLLARQRAADMVRVARGEPVQVVSRRRWPIAMAWLAGGTAIGLAVAFVGRRMATPIPPPMLDGQMDMEPPENVRTVPAEEPAPATP